MKLVQKANKSKLVMSKEEWIKIGKKYKWTKQAQQQNVNVIMLVDAGKKGHDISQWKINPISGQAITPEEITVAQQALGLVPSSQGVPAAPQPNPAFSTASKKLKANEK